MRKPKKLKRILTSVTAIVLCVLLSAETGSYAGSLESDTALALQAADDIELIEADFTVEEESVQTLSAQSGSIELYDDKTYSEDAAESKNAATSPESAGVEETLPAESEDDNTEEAPDEESKSAAQETLPAENERIEEEETLPAFDESVGQEETSGAGSESEAFEETSGTESEGEAFEEVSGAETESTGQEAISSVSGEEEALLRDLTEEEESSSEESAEEEDESSYGISTYASTSSSVTCQIESDKVVFSGVTSAKTKVYLLSLAPYETNVSSAKSHGSVTSGSDGSYSLSTDLKEGTSSSLLYRKFAAATKSGSSYTLLTSWQYISNPEVLASYTKSFPTSSSKKGLMVTTDSSLDSDLSDLGVNHALINIVVSDLFTTKSDKNAISYSYNGTTYYFSKDLITHYDDLTKRLNKKGIVVTAVLLNRYASGSQCSDLFCTGKNSSAAYYQFNTETANGLNQCAAVASFLADRYAGSISNWILGNEVNNQYWNYYGKSSDLDTVAEVYARSLRVFYTAIRSQNKNARVYISLDHEWTTVTSSTWYAGKDFLNKVNKYISAEGDIDWGVAYHPHSVPLNETSFWDDNVSQNENATQISMKNIGVLTNYLLKDDFLYNGNVRHVILSEQGFTSMEYNSTMRQKRQAAAFAYAYYIAEANPYIDSFILYRQVDANSEIEADSEYFGIWSSNSSTGEANTRKYIWQVYRDIDTDKSKSVTSFALDIIGYSSWDSALSACAATGSVSYSEVISRLSKNASKDVSGLTPSVIYQGYFTGSGWNDAVTDRSTCGTTKSGKKMQAVSIFITDMPCSGSVKYRSYLSGSGWRDYVTNSDSTGGQSSSKNMTALQVNLSGDIANEYDIVYRVYLHSSGWSSWKTNGATAGSTSSSSYIEAVQIFLQKKGVLSSSSSSTYKVSSSKATITMDGSKNGITVSKLSSYLIPNTSLKFQKSGKTLSDSALVTNGTEVVHSYTSGSSSKKKTYQVIIRGDGNGDGIVNIADITKMVGVMVGTSSVSGVNKEGCDTNGDGTINIADITKAVGLMQ